MRRIPYGSNLGFLDRYIMLRRNIALKDATGTVKPRTLGFNSYITKRHFRSRFALVGKYYS
jgi:hypothetical protein